MKDISFYFSPVSEEHRDWAESLSPSMLGSMVVKHGKKFIQPEPRSIAIFTVPEFRGSSSQAEFKDLGLFRDYFYKLFAPAHQVDLYDLGDILPGSRHEDTLYAVRDVCAELIKHNVIPVMIGGSEDLAYANYLAYEKLEQTLNVVAVDHKIDMEGLSEDEQQTVNEHNYLTRIILHQPAMLFNLSVLGVQGYLVDPEIRDLMDRLFFDVHRLGEMQADISLTEPVLRGADMVTIDLASVRRSDFRATLQVNPNGWYGEELCRIARYAGMSDKLSSIGFFGLNGANESGAAAHLLAQAIWHFVDGVGWRKKDFPVTNKSEYIKFIVMLNDNQHELIFYKSPRTDRWWMEVPYPPEEKIRFQRHLLVPCAYSDYEYALKDGMPDLWWRTYQRLHF